MMRGDEEGQGLTKVTVAPTILALACTLRLVGHRFLQIRR